MSKFVPIFAIPKQNGALAERLGTGLQNLLQRFDSARHLTKPLWMHSRGVFYFRGSYFVVMMPFLVVIYHIFKG